MKISFPFLILGLSLSAIGGTAGDVLQIQVRVFQGVRDEGDAGFKEDVVLTASSTPAFSRVKAKAGGPEKDLAQAAAEALLEALGWQSIDDLFAFALDWEGTATDLSQRIVHPQGIFEFSLAPRRASPREIEIKFIVHKSKKPLVEPGSTKTKDEELAKSFRAASTAEIEKILEKTLIMEIGEPVAVAVPSDGKIWIFMILPTSASETKLPAAESVTPAPKVLHQVLPAYPDELRKQGVKGEVEIRIAVDEEGFVSGTKVTKSLHPYLDYAAIQALLQWRFEPLVQNGKPVPALMSFSVLFDPEIYRREEERARQDAPEAADSDTAGHSNLTAVLKGCAEYCRKLSGAVLDFACEETIKEIRHTFTGMKKWSAVAVRPRGGGGGEPYIVAYIPTFDSERTEKNNFLCDYMLVKKGDRIEERRIILKENGRARPDREKLLEGKRFAVLSPLFVSLKLLDAERQSLFNYRILDEEKIQGHKAYVLEAIPKLGDSGGVSYARIWVDRTGFQILRSEIKGVPLEGYEDVLNDSVQHNIKPDFVTTHIFKIEHKGVLYPSRSEIRVSYHQSEILLAPKTLKIKADLTYDQYKFFTVETESLVIR